MSLRAGILLIDFFDEVKTCQREAVEYDGGTEKHAVSVHHSLIHPYNGKQPLNISHC